ncbi:hypothetical protein D9M68_862670 [compost metagenome]
MFFSFAVISERIAVKCTYTGKYVRADLQTIYIYRQEVYFNGTIDFAYIITEAQVSSFVCFIQ